MNCSKYLINLPLQTRGRRLHYYVHKKVDPSHKSERGGTSILIKMINKKIPAPKESVGVGWCHPGLVSACSRPPTSSCSWQRLGGAVGRRRSLPFSLPPSPSPGILVAVLSLAPAPTCPAGSVPIPIALAPAPTCPAGAVPIPIALPVPFTVDF